MDNVALLFYRTEAPEGVDVILDQGLDDHLSEVRLVGKGIYFSDSPAKALQYCMLVER
jgi:hypothetical protein